MGQQPGQEPSDNELLVGIGRGDPLALRLLMDRFDRLVRYVIYRASRQRCRRDPLWLDSVASEVWSDLCRSAGSSAQPDVANVASYLIQITRRRCIDALRRHGGAGAGSDPPPGINGLQPASTQEDTLEMLAKLEELAALRECIHQLGDADGRLCGEINAITAGRWTEAAQRLGTPESTLRSRWARILANLRRCLEKKGKSPRA